MKIEVGEYIRTISGDIYKYDEINQYILDCDLFYNRIVKHSKNIIDLIEVGDIIEIQTGLYNIYKINIEDEDTLICTKESLKGWTLKSILTKEQYEQNSYKI